VGNPLHNTGLDGKTLTFYLKPEREASKEDPLSAFKKFSIELLPLKP
jgi:hypothetical protein